MVFMETRKRVISVLLVLALLFAPVLQTTAEEMEQTPEQTECTEPDVTESSEETEVPEESETREETEGTEAYEETEAPVETEAITEPEETIESTGPEVQEAAPGVLTIAEVLRMAPGGENLSVLGTVVFAAGTQAVVQDDTGGIRLSFPAPPDIAPGDILLLTGRRSGGFAVQEFEKTGTGALPELEATLAEDRNAVRILVKGAILGRNSISQNGCSCQLEGTVPEGIGIGDRVDIRGVILDGVFYADTITASEVREPELQLPGEWNVYFGQLHAHTNISDGLGTVEEAFAYASQVENLDFFAVTDHSNAFDNGTQGAVDVDGTTISREWAAGKEAAKAVTDENFVGIFGYEMTWQEDLAIGHINTFGTPGWLTRDQAGMNTLEGYLDALEAVPDSVSQFNHPDGIFGDFRDFTGCTPQYDARVHLIEVGGEGSFSAYRAYTTALDKGWHLAPGNNQNNHNGNWGNAGQARTVILASELTEQAIYDAVRNYRVYAAEDADLKILYRLNDRIMGSILEEAAVLTADICLEDGSGDPIGLVEVVTDGGEVAASLSVPEAVAECSLEIPSGGSYYYLRITRDGAITAVTAPVWVDSYEDLGIESFSAAPEEPEQGTETELTLTLYNHENLPFVVESVVFSAGSRVIETVSRPGSVASMGELQIPLTYTQETPGKVTITAEVSGTIGELSRTFQKDVTLHFQSPEAQLVSVEALRQGMLGEAYRIRGYVTAGTSNPHNTFPGSIYLQDDTGGIQITDFAQTGIPLGTPMEVEGILRSVGGNPVLAMTDYETPAEDSHRYAPRTMTHKIAMNYEAHGGELLQIEGSVVSVTKTADGRGISRLTLRDVVGDLATVSIENGIGSGAYGTNTLASEVKTTRTVRAAGLLHMDEYGQPVLRVRNCDEVIYVPPKADRTNPKTGDFFAWLCSR